MKFYLIQTPKEKWAPKQVIAEEEVSTFPFGLTKLGENEIALVLDPGFAVEKDNDGQIIIYTGIY